MREHAERQGSLLEDGRGRELESWLGVEPQLDDPPDRGQHLHGQQLYLERHERLSQGPEKGQQQLEGVDAWVERAESGK